MKSQFKGSQQRHKDMIKFLWTEWFSGSDKDILKIPKFLK